MPTPDEGLNPVTVTDHFLAAILDEIREAVKVLHAIRMTLDRQAKAQEATTHALGAVLGSKAKLGK